MGLSVVRCTACLGVSQVDAGALGLTVRCPRCDATFVAVEEMEDVAPTRPVRNPTPPVPVPLREPRRARRRRAELTNDREPPATPDANHDPHLASSGPLPASVLIGLALLPFAIPIFWLVAPAVTGVKPAMSIATPSALALSASILCLAVIYTVDWTPTTRIKGVLMLVGLAYFSAVSLYFLKKEMVERVKRFTGLDERIRWQLLNTGDYQVKLPGPPQPVKAGEAPVQSIRLDSFKAEFDQPIGKFVFVVGSGDLPKNANGNAPKPAIDQWFDQLAKEIIAQSRGQLHGKITTIKYREFPGRQWEIQLPEKGQIRIVQVIAIMDRFYYLAAEGFALNARDDHVRTFLNSFHVPRAAN